MRINDQALAENLLAMRKRSQLTFFSYIRLNVKRYSFLFLVFALFPAILAYGGAWTAAKLLAAFGAGFLLCDLLKHRRYNIFWPFNEKTINWARVTEIAEGKGVPPVIGSSNWLMARLLKITGVYAATAIFLCILVPIAIFLECLVMPLWPTISGQFGGTRVSKENRFRVTVREVSSRPGVFSERVALQCDGDMKARLSVTDLKGAGFFENIDSNGMTYYVQGYPDLAAISLPVGEQKGTSICTISFQATTTPSNTWWHAEQKAETRKDSRFGLFSFFQPGASEDTALPEPAVVSQVLTNWSGTYRKGAKLPLATLGNYKILVSAE